MYALVVVAHGASLDGVAARLGPSDLTRLALADEVARGRFLAGRSAILTAVSRLVGSPVDALMVDAACPDCGGPHGRPAVSGVPGGVHVALAHGENHAFAVAARMPVGIDAEPRSTPRARLDAIRDVTGHRRGDSLARWTAIEAILKADGRGLRVDPRDVRVGLRGGRVVDRGIRYRLQRHCDVDGCRVAIAWAQVPDRRDRPGPAGDGSAGSAPSYSHASKSPSSGASANPAANRRKSSVDAVP